MRKENQGNKAHSSYKFGQYFRCLAEINTRIIQKLLTTNDELTGVPRPCCFIPDGIKIHEHDASAMTIVTLFDGHVTPILGSYKKYERIKGLGKTGVGEANMWVSQLKDLGLNTPDQLAAHLTAGCTDGAPFEAGQLFPITFVDFSQHVMKFVTI